MLVQTVDHKSAIIAMREQQSQLLASGWLWKQLYVVITADDDDP